MKIAFQFLLVTSLFSQVCGAQSTSPKQEQIKQEAVEQHKIEQENFDAIATKISQKINLSDNIAGSFQQNKFINVLPQALKSKGSFTYSKQLGLEWFTTQPIKSRLTFNEKGIRQEMDGKVLWEVEAEQPAVATITRVIVSVLALDWKTLQDYFLVNAGFEGEAWHINLVPKEQAMLSIINSLKVTGQNQLEKLVLFEANDDRTEIEFTFKSQQ